MGLKPIHLIVDLAAEDSVQAVGLVSLEINHFQVLLFTYRNKPIPISFLVEDLLKIDDLFSVVADSRIDVLHVID